MTREDDAAPQDDGAKGRPLALDPGAISAAADLPAFLAPPPGAPAYYGFPVLDAVEVNGFRFGMITDFLAAPDVVGDSFVVAPDGSRAGLVWEVAAQSYFEQVLPPEPNRWGVWAVTFPEPMRDQGAVQRNLAAILPQLQPQWEAWRRTFGEEEPQAGGNARPR